MRRFVAAFFRRAFIVILPAIVIPIIFVFVVRSLANSYSSEATIVISNTLVSYPGDNPIASPADNLSGRMNEALTRRSFVLQVANATDMPKTYKPGTSGVDDLMVDRIVSSLAISVVGAHTLIIDYSDSNPRVAAQVIQAFLNQYIVTSIQQAQDSAQQALQIYEQQLTQDQNTVNKANQDLQSYLTSHPTADPTTDATLAQLETAYQQDLSQVSNDLANIQGVNSQTYLLETIASFEVTDPPTIPTAPTVQSKTTITAMVGGVALGLGVSLGLIGLFAILDRRIYSRDDLVEAMPVPVLEVLPRLRGLQHDQNIVDSEEDLRQLSNVPVLAILPRSAQSSANQDSNSAFTSRVEEN